MTQEYEKTILRFVQDYCYKRNINNLVSEFALTIAPKLARAIMSDSLIHTKFESICIARKDFFIANDLDKKIFLIGLYRELKLELSYYIFDSLLDSLCQYKRRMENGNLKGFPKGTKEDTLRSSLSIYLQYENFCEPRCGSGNSDMVIPSQQAIIETKIWKGVENYNSGIPELKEYLLRQNYSNGFYVVYDYNSCTNDIIREHGEIFNIKDGAITIHIVFIRMCLINPSQIYKMNKTKNPSH